MKFIIIMAVLIYIGRKVGWVITKRVLLQVNTLLAVIVLVVWGGGMGFAVGCLDWNLNPNWIIKIVFGLFGGLYVAQPHFGLFDQNSILMQPVEVQNRNATMTIVPQLCFVVVAGVMVYFNIISNYSRS